MLKPFEAKIFEPATGQLVGLLRSGMIRNHRTILQRRGANFLEVVEHVHPSWKSQRERKFPATAGLKRKRLSCVSKLGSLLEPVHVDLERGMLIFAIPRSTHETKKNRTFQLKVLN